ncbi:MAG: hypothetical protein AAB222_03935, partial [Candidatus Binatota bacterium]
SVRANRLCDFRQAFSMLAEDIEDLFSRFFDREPHTHAELVAFVFDPRAVVGTYEGYYPGARCPLCGFPTYTFEPEPERLAPEVANQITQDFPHWQCADGLCTQCADLYRARNASASATQSLPGNLFLGPQS